MQTALTAQLARSLDRAERLYREALAIDPDLPDALHMLGVIRYERHDYDEARRLIVRALELTGWTISQFRHNLALVVSRANERGPVPALGPSHPRAAAPDRAPCGAPKVAVVVPAYGHARYVETALRSVFAQTWRDIEIVLIDDGSTDATLAVATRMLERSPFPYIVHARPNQGAAATINEAISLSTAPFVNVLNSDDAFEPERVATMVARIAREGRRWGFSLVRFIDDDGRDIDLLADARAYRLSCAAWSVPLAATPGWSLLASNVAISSGNLFFDRDLWRELGGFRALRYNHDWDFALRALWQSEPVFVHDALYRYRLHGGNTILESDAAARAEAHGVVRDYLSRAAGGERSPNPLAPSSGGWGRDFAVGVLRDGVADSLDAETLRAIVAQAEAADVQA